jgi:hypothetical protein
MNVDLVYSIGFSDDSYRHSQDGSGIFEIAQIPETLQIPDFSEKSGI